MSLRNTIKDLQIQRQELDTTIKVLNNYLNQILSTSKTNSLKRNKPDGHWPRYRKGINLLHTNRGKSAKLGYNNYQKLESGIEQLLQGTAKDEWATIKGTVQPGTNTIQIFDRQIEVLQKIYIPEPAAVENQKSYLLRVKKNDRLTVPQFLDRLKQINLLLSQ